MNHKGRVVLLPSTVEPTPGSVIGLAGEGGDGRALSALAAVTADTCTGETDATAADWAIGFPAVTALNADETASVFADWLKVGMV